MLRVQPIRALTLTLLCGVALLSHAAGRIIVNVDMTTKQALVDLNVRDAELSQVLTALFNATSDMYNVKIGTGVTGQIDSLKLTQQPFDEALETILNEVDPSFVMTKQGADLYLISSEIGSGISIGTEVVTTPNNNATKKESVIEKNKIKVIKAKLKPASNSLSGATTTATSGLLTGGATATDTAAKECLLAMITIKNISVSSLSEAFGFGSIPTFSDDYGNDSGYGGSSRGSSRSSRRGRGGNDSGYDSGYDSSYDSSYDRGSNRDDRNNRDYDNNRNNRDNSSSRRSRDY